MATEPGSGQGSLEWDLIVIGGGITGAGILREAARRGLKAILIEQRDFAWGTSSRSSKMVHGGLRYLLSGDVRLTRDSLRQRDRLLREAPGLVDPMGFLYADYRGRRPGRWSFMALLTAYDLLGGRWNHRYWPPHEFTLLAPRINLEGLKGGVQSGDAVTDDARLVLRVIREAQGDGAFALNYVSAENLLRQKNRVCGVSVKDGISGATGELWAKVVMNATGAWADRLRSQVGERGRIRPLRGSHLVFPFWRIPVAQAVTLKHPGDGRPVFIMPWEGVTLVGNTDLDHQENLDQEAHISESEVDYLLEAVGFQFPSLDIGRQDIIVTFAGVRPVVGGGVLNPSKEKRDHSIWEEQGLISVTGGKLTTFHLMAMDAFKCASRSHPSWTWRDGDSPLFRRADERVLALGDLDASLRRRLAGRYGFEAEEVFHCAAGGELDRVPGTDTLWAELRWAARNEAVVHLEDLLLRRSRLGLLLPEGGKAHFHHVRRICREELGWDGERWEEEEERYGSLWRRCYAVPGRPG